MEEVEVRFEREGRSGIVAAGTYLIDAAKRLGIKLEGDCSPVGPVHFCSMIVKSGMENLSALTHAETEHFSANGRRNGERLACQAKIEKPGEVVIMTDEKKEAEAQAEEATEEYVKNFSDLPLEKKIANLMKLEAIALGETVSYVINSPFTIADKVMGVMAEFGFKKEEEARQAARPDEAATEPAAAGTETAAAGTGTARKKTTRKSAPKKKA
jgi:ferredoxin